MYVSLRGPRPLTGNIALYNNAVGGTPGVGVIQVTEGGRGGELIAVAPITHVVDGLERADPHAVRVREVPPRSDRPAAPAAGIAGLPAADRSADPGVDRPTADQIIVRRPGAPLPPTSEPSPDGRAGRLSALASDPPGLRVGSSFSPTHLMGWLDLSGMAPHQEGAEMPAIGGPPS
jgi:hypothetical protein